MNEPTTEVFEAELTPEEVRALFRDLALTTVLEVRTKGAGSRRASDETISLALAEQHWLDATIRGVRIVYEHAGHEWCDTLLRMGESTRLFRVRHIYDSD